MAESYTVVPLSGLRKVIAARMTEAKRTIPHFRLIADIRVDALLAMRERTNATDPSKKISINDCLIKACATSLMQHPDVNVQLNGQEIHRYRHADIGVIVAVEGGLSMPVIRSADRKCIHDIAAEARALSARAATGQLRMDEIMGGSFSISNLGAYDVDEFDAIINPPQCAILAVGTAKPRMIVLESGEASVAKIVRATLSVDHRAIDGATAAKFMATLRRTLEDPQQLFSTQIALSPAEAGTGA